MDFVQIDEKRLTRGIEGAGDSEKQTVSDTRIEPLQQQRRPAVW